MPVKRFPLELGGPQRLTISYGRARWSQVTVQLDGQLVAKFSVNALLRGRDVPLPDGTALRLSFDPNLGALGNLQVLKYGAPAGPSGVRPVTVIQAVTARSQALLGYAFMFAAFGTIAAAVGVGVGIAFLVGGLSAQLNPIVQGALVIVGGLILGALCWITARGLWRLQSWARIPALVVVGCFELLFVLLLLGSGDLFLLIPIVGVAIPAIQLMMSNEFTAKTPAKSPPSPRVNTSGAVSGAVSAAASHSPAPASGPTREQFERQVERVLTSETRLRLQIRIDSDPLRCWFPIGNAWGWIECHNFDAVAGGCADWEVTLPGGRKTIIALSESALITAISGG
jgi:hypothetical protein